MNNEVLIIGVGNPDRGDDAIGPLAARRVEELQIPGVRIIIRSGGLLTMIDDWRDANGLILVDAAESQADNPEADGRHDCPARVHRIDVVSETLPRGFTNCSTHGFGVAEAIELAKALGALPRRAVVYAIEGRSFETGSPLSPAVAGALDGLVEQIKGEAEGMRADAAH